MLQVQALSASLRGLTLSSLSALAVVACIGRSTEPRAMPEQALRLQESNFGERGPEPANAMEVNGPSAVSRPPADPDGLAVGAPWSFRFLDGVSGQPIQMLGLNFARCPIVAESGGMTYVTGDTDSEVRVVPRGLVQRCLSGQNWSFKARAPGYASCYGLVSADRADTFFQTVRMDPESKIIGRVRVGGGARVECQLNEEHSASQRRLDMLWHCGRLDRLFDAERHVAVTSDDGSFEIGGMAAAAYTLTVSLNGTVIWDSRTVITRIGDTTVLGTLP